MRLIVGMQPVREAIAAHGERLERVIVANGAGPKVEAVARFAADRGAKVERVDKRELDKIARGAYHQSVVAFAPELSFASLEAVATTDKPEGDRRSPPRPGQVERPAPSVLGAMSRHTAALTAGAIVLGALAGRLLDRDRA